SVIIQLGHLLAARFTGDEITGRFGGDEFILFIKNTDDTNTAGDIARDIATEVSNSVKLPDESEKLSISIGIALYNGKEKNYSELFKKADIALYNAKSSAVNRFCVYEGNN
ncbi:MAG: GGDEF domain-containing protein, partial [Clostridia bacterium]|nr:GGDEF domain-containing protein [Clostridia bacterium]